MSETYITPQEAPIPQLETNRSNIEFAQLFGGLILGHIGMVEASLAPEETLAVVFECPDNTPPTEVHEGQLLDGEELQARHRYEAARLAVQRAQMVQS